MQTESITASIVKPLKTQVLHSVVDRPFPSKKRPFASKQRRKRGLLNAAHFFPLRMSIYLKCLARRTAKNWLFMIEFPPPIVGSPSACAFYIPKRQTFEGQKEGNIVIV